MSDSLLAGHAALSTELKRDKGAWIPAIALEHALHSAGLEVASVPPERRSLIVGSALAGQLGMIDFAGEVREQGPRFVTPIHFPQTVGNYPAGALARAYDIRGPNLTLASGEASSLDAILEGCEVLATGKADVVLAGGSEKLSPELAAGLGNRHAIISEGACLFVLEAQATALARGAAPLASITPSRSLANQTNAREELDNVILSSGSGPHPGAISIEHWTGRCLGAAGAAALAAAIGAAKGLQVPLADIADRAVVSIRRIVPDVLDVKGDTLPALVFADSECAHRTTLGLTIPR